MRLTRNTLRQMILREMRAQGGQDMPTLRSAPGEQGQPHRAQLSRREKAVLDIVLAILGDPENDLKNMMSAEVEALVATYTWHTDRTLLDPVIDKLEELGLGGMDI